MRNYLRFPYLLMILFGISLVTGTASARDERLRFPIAEAAAAAGDQFNTDIKLFWGSQSHPAPAQTFGTFTANRKTNFFNKTDKEGCEWVWLSSVQALQERAEREGGNAVVNIVSVYRNSEFSSRTEYECGAGRFVGGVALRGTVVRLP